MCEIFSQEQQPVTKCANVVMPFHDHFRILNLMRTCPCRVNRPKISMQKSLEDRCQFAKRGLFSQSTCSNRLTSVHMEASSGTVISTCFGGNKDFVAANTLRLQFSNLSLCKWPSLMLLFYFTIECSMSICSMS